MSNPNMGLGRPYTPQPLSPTGLTSPTARPGEAPLTPQAGAIITPHRQLLAEIEGAFAGRVREVRHYDHLSPSGLASALEALAIPLLNRLASYLAPDGVVVGVERFLATLKASVVPPKPADPMEAIADWRICEAFGRMDDETKGRMLREWKDTQNATALVAILRDPVHVGGGLIPAMFRDRDFEATVHEIIDPAKARQLEQLRRYLDAFGQFLREAPVYVTNQAQMSGAQYQASQEDEAMRARLITNVQAAGA